MKRGAIAVVALTLLAVALGVLRSRAAEKTARAALTAPLEAAPVVNDSSAEPAKPEPAKPEPVVAVVPPEAKPQPSAQLAEPALMSKLRDLGDSSPLVSLALAREGNQRFPNSPDAAERAWWVCKSLVNLADFGEARQEARAMVLRYPGTSFALDIERHLLINPGGPPDPPEENSDSTP